jgi:DNA-binding MarR family transcriptional regulator
MALHLSRTDPQGHPSQLRYAGMGNSGADDFQSAFWATKRAMTSASEAAFGRHGVRAGQQYILAALCEQDCQTPGELARRFGLATPTVTRTAMRMEAVGLITREPHPTDRRLVRLCVTQRGRQIRRAIDREMRELDDRALASMKPAERAELVRYLTKIRGNLAARGR